MKCISECLLYCDSGVDCMGPKDTVCSKYRPHMSGCHWWFVCAKLGKLRRFDNGLNKSRCPLRWRHNGRDSVSNHQPHHCLLNRLTKKTSKLRVTDLLKIQNGEPSPATFPIHLNFVSANSTHGNTFPWTLNQNIIIFLHKMHLKCRLQNVCHFFLASIYQPCAFINSSEWIFSITGLKIVVHFIALMRHIYATYIYALWRHGAEMLSTPQHLCEVNLSHYNDVIMSAMASKITCVSIVYLTVCSGVDQRNHQSSPSLAFVRGIHRWPVNSPHKRPVTRNMFPLDDVIMTEANNVELSCFLVIILN